jgi:hypothetical protein
MTSGAIWTVRDGRISRVVFYTSRDSALLAAGLSDPDTPSDDLLLDWRPQHRDAPADASPLSRRLCEVREQIRAALPTAEGVFRIRGRMRRESSCGPSTAMEDRSFGLRCRQPAASLRQRRRYVRPMTIWWPLTHRARARSP